MNKKPLYVHRRWLVVALIIELAYILAEFAFNAALLNTASGQVRNPDAIHQVELAGRLLSGVGLSILMYWTYFRNKIIEETVFTGIKTLALSMLICVPSMYFGQKLIVEKFIVNGTDGFQRQYAESLILLKNGLQTGAVTLKNVPLSENGITDPGDMAFMSVMGAIMMGIPDYANVILKNERSMVERVNLMTSKDTADQAYPIYQEGSNRIITGFRDYQTASNDYASKASANRGKIDQAWSEVERSTEQGYAKYRKALSYFSYMNDAQFRSRTGGYGKGINSITQFRASGETITRVNVSLNQRGLAINDKWDGTREGFMTIMNNGGILEWGDQMAKRSLYGLKPGLGFREFEQSSTIQNQLKDQMGKFYVAGMRLGLSKEDFTSSVIMVSNAKNIDAWVEGAKNRQYELADGGAREEEGRQFVRALIVPPIALLLSLFFSLLTLAKLPIRLISFKDKYEGNIPWVNKARKAIMAGDLVAILSLPMAKSDTKVMDSTLFKMMSDKGKNIVPLGDKAIVWLIKGEPLIYKAGQSLLESMGLDQRDARFKSTP
jgi:hypothetical protein